MKQKNYTLKECRVFNQKQFGITTAVMKETFKNTECIELILPDEAHPWNMLHAVIEQYYKREYKRVQTIDITRTEMDRATIIMNEYKEWNSTYGQTQKEISDLKQENERLKVELNRLEKSTPVQSIALQKLLKITSVTEWGEITGDILDGLIKAMWHTEDISLSEQMICVRHLQKFFAELEKETN